MSPHRHPAPLGEPAHPDPRGQASARVEFHFRICASLKSHLGWVLLPALRHGGLPAPLPYACSPVEADLVETLFTRLVDGVEAGAWVLFLPAVWVMGRIRRAAAAWGPVLGRAPNTAHQDRLSYGGLGPPCALWPGAHTHRGMHSCTDSG